MSRLVAAAPTCLWADSAETAIFFHSKHVPPYSPGRCGTNDYGCNFQCDARSSAHSSQWLTMAADGEHWSFLKRFNVSKTWNSFTVTLQTVLVKLIVECVDAPRTKTDHSCDQQNMFHRLLTNGKFKRTWLKNFVFTKWQKLIMKPSEHFVFHSFTAAQVSGTPQCNYCAGKISDWPQNQCMWSEANFSGCPSFPC